MSDWEGFGVSINTDLGSKWHQMFLSIVNLKEEENFGYFKRVFRVILPWPNSWFGSDFKLCFIENRFLIRKPDIYKRPN